MHIVYDFRPALSQSTGVGTYVQSLVAALCEAYPEDDYTVFSASWRDRLDPALVPTGVAVADRRVPVRLLNWAWHRWRRPGVERFVGAADIAHSPSPMLLPSRSASTVVTVHDCYFMRHPEDVFGPVRRDYVPLARRSAAAADAVVVNSESTASEARELLCIDPAKIWVTPLGVSRRFFAPAVDAARAVLERYALVEPFVLFVGRREKRKDLATLLATFDKLLEDGEDLLLALVGPNAPGWEGTWQGASARVRRSTRLIPYLGTEQLAALYAAASLLVIPSRWEGFGLTGLEAMAAGTPVVATRVGALPEVLGDAALFAPAADPTAMAEQCRRAIYDDDTAQRLRAAGRERAVAFRWQETARRTHELYCRLRHA